LGPPKGLDFLDKSSSDEEQDGDNEDDKKPGSPGNHFLFYILDMLKSSTGFTQTMSSSWEITNNTVIPNCCFNEQI